MVKKTREVDLESRQKATLNRLNILYWCHDTLAKRGFIRASVVRQADSRVPDAQIVESVMQTDGGEGLVRGVTREAAYKIVREHPGTLTDQQLDELRIACKKDFHIR